MLQTVPHYTTTMWKSQDLNQATSHCRDWSYLCLWVWAIWFHSWPGEHPPSGVHPSRLYFLCNDTGPFHHPPWGTALIAKWSRVLVEGIASDCAFSQQCLGSNLSLAMLESCQWLGVRRWFSLSTLVSFTTYNWLVMIYHLQYGRTMWCWDKIPHLIIPNLA